MLREVAERLDAWMIDQNVELRAEGLPTLRPCEIKVVGQAALLEAGLPLRLAATRDVDVKASFEHVVERELRRLLEERGRELDAVGHEVWMPRETRFAPLYSGKLVTVLLADPEAVLLSKALKAPAKNRPLVIEYLARGASQRFLQLAERYGLDLEQFT